MFSFDKSCLPVPDRSEKKFDRKKLWKFVRKVSSSLKGRGSYSIIYGIPCDVLKFIVNPNLIPNH